MTTSLRSYFGKDPGTGAVVFSQIFENGLKGSNIESEDAK